MEGRQRHVVRTAARVSTVHARYVVLNGRLDELHLWRAEGDGVEIELVAHLVPLHHLQREAVLEHLEAELDDARVAYEASGAEEVLDLVVLALARLADRFIAIRVDAQDLAHALLFGFLARGARRGQRVLEELGHERHGCRLLPEHLLRPLARMSTYTHLRTRTKKVGSRLLAGIGVAERGNE